MGDGSFSENGTMENDLSLTFQIWGSGPQEEEFQVGGKVTEVLRIMTNTRDGFTEEKAF